MKKNIKSIIAAVVLILLTVVSVMAVRFFYGGKTGNISRSLTREHFGTIMTITLYGDSQDELDSIIEDSFKEIDRLEKIFSAKLSDSELAGINKKAFDEEVKVSKPMCDVLEQAIYYCNLSEGALDVTIGNIVDMWGIGTNHERIPQAEELELYANASGFMQIMLAKDNETIRFKDDKIKLDLGAVAKGYAADAVKKIISDKNSTYYGILDFGGNIMTIGSKQGNQPWVIGITNPFNTGNVYATVEVIDKCVVTSGNYERYFEKDGVRYHHILDPFTGKPADSGLVSTTIIGGNSLECDALSTACFIMGAEKGMKLIDGIDGVEALFIDKNGQYYKSKGIDGYNLQIRYKK